MTENKHTRTIIKQTHSSIYTEQTGTGESCFSETSEQGCQAEQKHGDGGRGGGVAAVRVAVAIPALKSVCSSTLQAVSVDLSTGLNGTHVQAAGCVLLVDVHFLFYFKAHSSIGCALHVILASFFTRAGCTMILCITLEAFDAQTLLNENRKDEDGTENEMG